MSVTPDGSSVVPGLSYLHQREQDGGAGAERRQRCRHPVEQCLEQARLLVGVLHPSLLVDDPVYRGSCGFPDGQSTYVACDD